MKVYKYGIHYYSVPESIELPKSALILGWGIQEHNDPKIVMWAAVEPDTETETRVFLIAMTGQEIPGTIVKGWQPIQFPNGIVGTLLEITNVEAQSWKDDPRAAA